MRRGSGRAPVVVLILALTNGLSFPTDELRCFSRRFGDDFDVLLFPYSSGAGDTSSLQNISEMRFNNLLLDSFSQS